MGQYFINEQCRLSHNQGPVGFRVKECEKFINMVLVSTSEPMSKKWPLVEFWCVIKEKYLQIYGFVIKIFLAFPIACFQGQNFLHTLQQKQRIQQVECWSRSENPATCSHSRNLQTWHSATLLSTFLLYFRKQLY